MPLDDAAPAALAALFGEVRGRLAAEFAAAGIADGLAYSLVAEMRFVGQAFEVPIQLPADALPGLTRGALEDAFLRGYREIYLHAGTAPVEIVTLRVVAKRPLEHLPAMREVGPPQGAAPAPHSTRVTGIAAPVPVRPASALRTNEPCAGPVILSGHTVTIFVPQRWNAVLDEHANIVMRRESA